MYSSLHKGRGQLLPWTGTAWLNLQKPVTKTGCSRLCGWLPSICILKTLLNFLPQDGVCSYPKGSAHSFFRWLPKINTFLAQKKLLLDMLHMSNTFCCKTTDWDLSSWQQGAAHSWQHSQISWAHVTGSIAFGPEIHFVSPLALDFFFLVCTWGLLTAHPAATCCRPSKSQLLWWMALKWGPHHLHLTVLFTLVKSSPSPVSTDLHKECSPVTQENVLAQGVRLLKSSKVKLLSSSSSKDYLPCSKPLSLLDSCQCNSRMLIQ